MSDRPKSLIQGKSSMIKAACLLTIAGLFSWPPPTYASEVHRPISLKFIMSEEKMLFISVTNTSEIEASFLSYLSAVLDSKFLDFPTQGSLQFEEKKPWISIIRYSSQADPPDMAKNLFRMNEIQIQSGEAKEFRLDYSRAIDISTSQIHNAQLMPSKFRVKFPIEVSDD